MFLFSLPSEYIELVWHNADTWSVDDGPAWYNVDGDQQTGIPQIGADVVIPRGIKTNLKTVDFLEVL